jgi:hypothetical protein
MAQLAQHGRTGHVFTVGEYLRETGNTSATKHVHQIVADQDGSVEYSAMCLGAMSNIGGAADNLKLQASLSQSAGLSASRRGRI